MSTGNVIFPKLLPIADSAILVPDYTVGNQGGHLPVEFVDNGTAVRIIAIIVNDGTIPTDPSYDYSTAHPEYITIDKSGGVFSKPDFPISGMPQNAPQRGDRKKLYSWYFDASQARTAGTTILFYAIPKTSTIAVSAQHCIWLTYAIDSTPALPTHSESVAAGNRPLFLRIPDDVITITVSPNETDQWTHHAGDNLTTYVGRPGTEEDLTTTVPDYLNVGGANGIIGQRFVLNRLVGLWEYSDKSTATTELDLGANATRTLTISDFIVNRERPVALRLAMHDGYQWTNNAGTINVTLECTLGAGGGVGKQKGP